MDVLASFIAGSITNQQTEPKKDNKQDEMSPINMLGQLLEVQSQPTVSAFEEQLIYGINVTVMGPRGRSQWCTCYLHEDSVSLLCFVNREDPLQQIQIFDLKNMDIEDFNQAAVTINRSLQVIPYLSIRQRTSNLILLFTNNINRDQMHHNFRMLRLKLNLIEPYDQEFSQQKKMFSTYCDKNNQMKLDSARQLLFKLNYTNRTWNEEALKLVKEINKNEDQPNIITYNEFMEFLRLSFSNPIMHQIFNKYCADKVEYSQKSPNAKTLEPLMTDRQFKIFLIEQQKETPKRVGEIAQSLSLNMPSSMSESMKRSVKETACLSLYSFSRFIFSNQNSVLDPTLRQIYQDMTHPLNHYYCFSSHNTYLTGNQLTSDSKVQRYIEDLDRGLKCVEIDVHEAAGNIIVKHGYTATASILFADVIEAISKYSEKHPGHYPIIISLEVHLEPLMREKMAEILLEHFNQKIVLIEKGFKSFPSPEQLRGKVIIKTDCQLDPSLTLEQIERQQDEDASTVESRLKEVKKQWIKKDSKTMLVKLTSLYKGKYGTESSYCQNVSMDWQKLVDHVKKEPLKVVTYTSRSWLRVYPHGTQFLSSNFNPIPMMEIGAQIIALNTQVRDVYYYLLHAHFRENCCGYLLKHQNLRIGVGMVPDVTIKLSIQVVAALNIRSLTTFEQFKYNVKMGFFGSQKDNTGVNCMGQIKPVTEEVEEEDPIFKSSQPLFFILSQPQFGFFFFEITNFGRIAVPVRMMRQGYRSVQLLNKNFQPIGSSYILLRVDIQKY